MQRLGHVIARWRWAVLAATAVFVVVAGAVGGDVKSRLSAGGFEDTAAPSTRAAHLLESVFGQGSPNIVLVVTAKGGDVDAPEVVARGNALTQELATVPGVTQATSYWSLGSPPPLKGTDGRQALVLARVKGDEDAVRDAAAVVGPAFTRSDDTIDVRVGGPGEVFMEISHQAEKDLTKAEAISLPVTLLLLLLVFGSVVAASLPLLVGAIAVVGTFAVLTAFTGFTEVSVFALNLTTALGLGLAIDYSLFIVSRYREELAHGRRPEVALLRTMQTAGRTVVFSACTVAISLGALLVFPLSFLRSFAYAGVGVVALAAAGAVIVLPALLAVLGPRVDKGRIRRRQREVTAASDRSGFWYKRAHAVMKRPVVIAVVATTALAVLGLPFFGFRAGQSDDRVLAEDAPVRQLHDELRRNFPSKESDALTVVATQGVGASSVADLDAYAAALSALEGVARVDASTGYYIGGRRVKAPDALSGRFVKNDTTWLSVVPSIEPISPEGQDLVADVRSVPSPFETVVGGPSAGVVDTTDALMRRLPASIALISIATFLLLFLMTGSIMVPVKALALNVLSLSATFGALVWIFQEGHLAGLLGFTPTGTIAMYTPILLFCIAFGLSMDYEVFLLSRIKEEYDLGRSNEESVAVGLEKTGGIVTAAALLLAVVFVAFATAEVSVVKVFGVGLTIAVMVDAFVIRTALVPAFMKLAGRANWWAPRGLRRFHLRFGVWENESVGVLDIGERAREVEFREREELASSTPPGAGR